MMRRVVRSFRAWPAALRLPPAAKAARRKDSLGVPAEDPGVERAIDEGVAWLGRAQDHSASADGGVARHYSLITGWGPSYPETTGYIIPTMLAYAKLRADGSVRQRAKRMLDWLVSIQLPEGGFQAGAIGSKLVVPVTFNTGQILLGLASGVREFGLYYEAMRRAADWLVKNQDADGCWRTHLTPHAIPGEKTYETHVAWGLLEAAQLAPEMPYGPAAIANLRWALRWQHDNGWFDKCCLSNPVQPLTHTLGYALRGIIEGYRFTGDQLFLQAAQRAADGVLEALHPDGFLPGRLGSNWRGDVAWACLTGTAQMACCWFLLFEQTGEARYRKAALAANRYVRRTMQVDGPSETRGAIKGSFPVYGQYGSYQYLNWATKFFIDANLLEHGLCCSNQ